MFRSLQFLLKTVIFVILTCGCAARTPFLQEHGLSDRDSAKIIIYRPHTMYHIANPELPFLYIDDKEVGKLAIGSFLLVIVRPGQYHLSMKEPILFQPSYESRSLTISVQAAETYYIRYSREMSGIVLLGDSVAVTAPLVLTWFQGISAKLGAEYG